MEFSEQIAVARQIAAIEKRNRELGVIGVVAVALGQGLTLGREGFPELAADFPPDAIQILVGNSAMQLKLRDGIQATLDGDIAQNGAALSKGAVLEVAGVRFQLIRTRSGP